MFKPHPKKKKNEKQEILDHFTSRTKHAGHRHKEHE